ncbi:MAG: hypothetical protein ACI4XA_03965 [Oscillospiraceae bacterium]
MNDRTETGFTENTGYSAEAAAAGIAGITAPTEAAAAGIVGITASPETAAMPDTAPNAEVNVATAAQPAAADRRELPPKNFSDELAEAERAQAEMEARDREFLASLDRILERQPAARSKPRSAEQAINKFALGVVKKGAGIISLSLILILLGVVMTCCLFSSAPDYLLPLKLSPIAAVLLGLELLAHYLTSKSDFRVHIPSIIISAALVVGCCIMCVKLNETYSEQKTEYSNRTIAAEIYDSSYKELRFIADISRLDVEVDLSEGTDRSEGINSLSAGDHVTVGIELGGAYSKPSEFARECKEIIDSYRILGIPIDDFHFVNEGRLHSYRLDVEGKFAQDKSESELAEIVSHIYLEDYDYIEDLDDFTDTSEETLETTTSEVF